MRIGLISSAYPPNFDGIGDYTWWLATSLVGELSGQGKRTRDCGACPVVVFTRIGMDHKPADGVEVARFFDPRFPGTFVGLWETIERDYSNPDRKIDWLVLQYNPFGWGRRGYCPWVPSTLHRLSQTPGAPRLAVMFHETMAPPWPWRFTVMRCWQWPIFRSVCRAVDVAFVSTNRWAPQVTRMAPQLPVHRLPVGSNIPLCEISRTEARRRTGIDVDALVLGVFGAAHVSRRLDWVTAAVAEAVRRRPGKRTILLYVGVDGNEIRRLCPDADLIDAGPSPAGEVSVRLRAMDAVLSPFVDGMSTRRTSVISVLHHGVPVATTSTGWTDDLFLSGVPDLLLLSSAASPEAFAAETAAWLEGMPSGGPPYSELTDFHDLHFSWPRIASTMLKHLHHVKD